MMKKKSLMVWSVMLVYLLMMIVSPLSVSAEESFEEISEDYSAPIAEEEQDYDEIGEPANTEFEEEWNLMQTDAEAYHELMEEKGYVYTLYKKDATAENVYINKPGNPGDHIILEAVWADSSPKTKSCQRRGLNDA